LAIGRCVLPGQRVAHPDRFDAQQNDSVIAHAHDYENEKHDDDDDDEYGKRFH
jgi:hypothetical protein